MAELKHFDEIIAAEKNKGGFGGFFGGGSKAKKEKAKIDKS